MKHVMCAKVFLSFRNSTPLESPISQNFHSNRFGLNLRSLGLNLRIL